MSLKKYKQEFIENSLRLDNGILGEPTILTLADIFEEIAKMLNVTKVYFWADLYNDHFILTKLSNSVTGEIKFVVYCFVNDQDAKRHPNFSAGECRVDSLNIFKALLQFLTLDGLDTIIFYNRKGKLNKSMAVDRHRLIDDFRRNSQPDGIVTKDVAATGHFGLT